MKCNMGSVDRTVRGILGLIIGLWGLTEHSWWGLIGAVLLLTSLTGLCPAYLPFKLSTRRDKQAG